MLKIGAVLYGSGYVLLAFLEGDFVNRLGWVTHQQVLDAVSIGQVTPGPVTIGLSLATLALLWRTRPNSAWFIAAGAGVGLIAG